MRILVLIMMCACALSTSLQAQEKTAAEYIGWKGIKVELHTIVNKELTYTLVMNDDSVRVYSLTNSGQVSFMFSAPWQKDEHFLGGFFKEQKLYLFSDYEKATGVNSVTYDFNSKSLTHRSFPFAIEKENKISHFSTGNYFCIFTIRKRYPDLILYRFSDGEKLDTLRFLSSPITKADISTNGGRSTVVPKIDVEKIDMAGECDLDIAKCQRKLYVQNDTMLLLLNNKKAVTEIYSFDLEHGRLDSRSIRHSPEGDTSLRVENSFLYQNKLLYAYASWDSLFIQVTDLYTGGILNSFRVYKEEDIAFKNTPLIQDGSYFGETSRMLGKTKQLLRKLMNSELVICASAQGNDIRVLLGSYKPSSNIGDNLFVMPGFGAGGAPGFGTFSVGGFSTGSWIKSAHFGMLLNSDAAFVEGDIPLSINEKINKYNRNIGFPAERENLIRLNGEYFYIFYTKRRRALEVVKF